MYSSKILWVTAAVFLVQMVLCFRCRRYFRYVPVFALIIMEIFLWLSFCLIRPGFYTFYAGMLFLVCLMAVLLAWFVWSVIQVIQK